MSTHHSNIIVLLMGTLALAGCRAVESAQREVCLKNLLQINEPLNCCIPMEHRLKPGTEIQRSDLLLFCKDRVLPRCPSGVEYRIPLVAGGRPVCPVHGDLLAGVTNVTVFGDRPIYLSEH